MPQGTKSAAAGRISQPISTTSTTVRATNAGRWQIDLTNPSDTVIWLALGMDAVAGEGIMLAPRGGSWSSDWFNGDVKAIHENKDAIGATTAGSTKTLTGAEV